MPKRRQLYDKAKIVFLNSEGVDDDVIIQVNGSIDEVILLSFDGDKEKSVFRKKH